MTPKRIGRAMGVCPRMVSETFLLTMERKIGRKREFMVVLNEDRSQNYVTERLAVSLVSH